MMNTVPENTPSAFAQIVDRLKNKSEDEIKLLSMKLFVIVLSDEWASITASADFGNASEEDIINVILKNRYSKKNV